jgi:CheY-like chemotaxis protein
MSDISPPVVLLVEDEPLVRLLVADLLLEAECRVLEAANASEALSILTADVPVDVVLADVDMPPGIDGYQLARQIHRHWPQIGILLTSGRHWPAEGDMPTGAIFLAKPCPNNELVAQVRAAASRVRASRPAGGSADAARRA